MSDTKPVLTEWLNKPNPDESDTNVKWWNEKKDNIHSIIFPLVQSIENYQSYKETQNLKYARLYSNMEMLGLSTASYAKVNHSNNWNGNRLTYNVVQSCVDAAASKIAKNKPRCLFLTKQGNYSLKRKAKKLTQYLDGQFEQCKIYAKGQRVFVDAAVFGTGAMKVFIDEGEVKVERVFINEIIIDDVEGAYGDPRQMHQRKNYSRDVLIEMFPKFKTEIMQSISAPGTATQTIADQIQVIESWHLPSTKGAADGKHSICISTATLFQETYAKDFFPIVFFRWIDKLAGCWGMGLAEQLIGTQLEINKVLINIQAAIHLMAVPRIFLETSSKVAPKTISNDIGAIIKYQGTKPSLELGQGMSPEVYNYLETLKKEAFEISGVSQLSAQSKKPSGLDSGAALREFQDIESERFMLTGMRYEQFYMDVAKVIIELTKDLYETDNKLSIKTATNKFVETIKWKDVNLKEDEYDMQMFPVSLLPTTPAGKLQTVQDLVQAQMIDPETALSLLDFPDLDSVLSRKNAAQNNIERILEKIQDDGKYQAPEKLMNLDLAISLTEQTILQAMNDGVDSDNIDLLRVFLEQCQTLLEPPPEPAPPPMPDPSMMPPDASSLPPDPLAVGAAPPVSPLLPFQG